MNLKAKADKNLRPIKKSELKTTSVNGCQIIIVI